MTLPSYALQQGLAMSDQWKSHSYLRRLPPEFYQSQACVHWTMAIEGRKTGWLIPIFYYKFRELLTHTAFRYGLCCPIFCLMPDHMHLLWQGIVDRADQRLAIQYFRKQTNLVLEKAGICLQRQPYEHVLSDEERLPNDFRAIAEYIARNPERKNLVVENGFRDYPYTHCLMPGYPDLHPFQSDYWELFDRIYSKLRKQGLTRGDAESP